MAVTGHSLRWQTADGTLQPSSRRSITRRCLQRMRRGFFSFDRLIKGFCAARRQQRRRHVARRSPHIRRAVHAEAGLRPRQYQPSRSPHGKRLLEGWCIMHPESSPPSFVSYVLYERQTYIALSLDCHPEYKNGLSAAAPGCTTRRTSHSMHCSLVKSISPPHQHLYR